MSLSGSLQTSWWHGETAIGVCGHVPVLHACAVLGTGRVRHGDCSLGLLRVCVCP